jgi:hypothetical protein
MNIEISNEVIVNEAKKGRSYFHVKQGVVRSVDPSNSFSYVEVGEGQQDELVSFLESLKIPFVIDGKWQNEQPMEGFPSWACSSAHK